MKILIQNRSTHLFLKKGNQWTSNDEEADCFTSALAAFEFTRSHSLEDTIIVFKLLAAPSIPRMILRKSTRAAA
jgi:hypothetical protein